MKEITVGMDVKILGRVKKEYPDLSGQAGVVERIIGPGTPNFVPDRAAVRLKNGPLVHIRLQHLRPSSTRKA